MQKIDKELKSYIENEILPIYDKFDGAHSRSHIKDVVMRALEIAEELPNQEELNYDIIYASASLHDIGMLKGRKGHAGFSGEFVRNCKELKKFFSPDEIEIIAEACADHSTSAGHIPRSIYGKIISDADKDNDIVTSLTRGWEYSTFNFPELTFQEHIDDIYIQIQNRFGKNGSVKFYLGSNKIKAYLDEMTAFVNDKELYDNKMKELFGNQKEL